MRYKLLEEHPRTSVLVFDTGDELAAELERFAAEPSLKWNTTSLVTRAEVAT